MKKSAFIITTVVFWLGAAVNTPAVDYSNLYVFGDSLSDCGQLFLSGKAFRATNWTDPSDPSSSLADVWSQYFSRSMGFGELQPSTPVSRDFLGTDYAVVANRTGQVLDSITQPNGSSVFGLKTRDGYLIENPHADGHALYVVWGGGNDLRDGRDKLAGGTSQDIVVNDIQAAAENLVAGVRALSAAGARYILVPNMVNIGDVPESAYYGREAEGQVISREFNDQLLSGVNSSGANVILADVYTFFEEVVDNAASFGYSTENHNAVAYFNGIFYITGIPAAEGVNGAGSTSPDPSKYVFFDGIHPTTKTHRMIAQYFESLLMAPEVISTLGEVPLSMSRQHHRQLINYLQTDSDFFQPRKFVAFFQGGYGDGDVDNSHGTPGMSHSQYNFSTGGAYGFSSNCYGGIAFGAGFADMDFNDSHGDADLKGGFISLFTGYRKPAFYFNGMATVGKLAYDKVNRRVPLGSVIRTHTGDTDADYWGINLSAGAYLFKWEKVTLGPEFEARYQEVRVDGYRETGNLSTAMTFGDQARYDLSGSLGIGINLFLGPMRLHGNIAFEKADQKDPRYIYAALNTIPDHLYKLEGFKPETEFWIFEVRSAIRLSEQWSALISLNFRDGDGDTENAGQLGIRYRF